MRPLISAWLYEDDDGSVEWSVRSHRRAEELGLAPVIAGGRVHASDPSDPPSSDPEDVSVALSIVGARVIRLSDSAAWSHHLL